MIERGLDVVECVIIVDGVGGTVVACSSRGSCARCNAGDVGGGEVGFEAVPSPRCRCNGIPFDEGLAVEARELDGHDGPVHHLFNSEGGRGDDGGNVAVFEAVKEGLDGGIAVPWGSKCRVVGLALHGGRDAVGGAEGQEDGAWVVVAAVRCRTDDGSPNGGGASLELLGYGDIQCGNDGTGDSSLGQICSLSCCISGFGVPRELRVKARLTMRAWVGRVQPWRGRLEGVFRWLFG